MADETTGEDRYYDQQAEHPHSPLVAVLLAGGVLAALDPLMTAAALPGVRDAFGVRDRILPWVVAVHSLGVLAGMPLIRKLSELFSRRLFFSASLLLLAAGSAMAAVADSFPALLTGRVVQGLGVGGIIPVAAAVLVDELPGRKQGKAFRLMAYGSCGAIAAAPLAGWLLMMLGWRWVFGASLPFALVILAAGWGTLPFSPQRSPKALDLPGLVITPLLAASLALAVNLADTEAPHFLDNLVSIRVWPLLLIFVLSLPLLVWFERRADDAVFRPSLMSRPCVTPACHLALASGAMEAGVLFIPLMAILTVSADPVLAARTLLPFAAAMAAGSLGAGWIFRRSGPKPLMAGGMLLLAAAAAIAGFSPPGMEAFRLYGALTGLGLAATSVTIYQIVVLADGERTDRAAAPGTVVIFSSMGRLLGIALVGAFAGSAVEVSTGYRHAFLALAAAAAAFSLLALIIPCHTNGDGDSSNP